jgi:hypothetical protein
LEIVADSIHCQTNAIISDLMPIIEIKIDSLTLHSDALFHITNTLKIKGSECYLLGNEFIIKLIKGVLLEYPCKNHSHYITLDKFIHQYFKSFQLDIEELLNKRNRNALEEKKTALNDILSKFEKFENNFSEE